MDLHQSSAHGLDSLQKISLTIMAALVLLTFVASNLHALLWQHSAWLVGAVLPAVVVELTNEERDDIALRPLVRNATLDEAATLKAQHMAKNEYFSHYSPDGVSPWYWFGQAGYSFAHAGENLAIHFTDSTEVVEAWMDSPTHRANIVNGQYTEIGVGTAKGTFDGFDTVYVVQLFGAPAAQPSAPVVAATPPTTVVPPVEVLTVSEVATPEVAAAELSTEPIVVAVNTEDTTVLEETTDVVTTNGDTVVIETSIATSSGLAIASIVETREQPVAPVLAGVMTKPHQLLTTVYIFLAFLAVGLLLISGVSEARRFHFVQVAYSAVLLVSMAGLWFAHEYLTHGALIA